MMLVTRRTNISLLIVRLNKIIIMNKLVEFALYADYYVEVLRFSFAYQMIFEVDLFGN